MKRTPKSQIKNALRRLWLMSKERAEALKRDNYSCQKCGVKQSKRKGFEVKVEVHHKSGKNILEELYELIYKMLLVHPDELETNCVECHKKETKKIYE